MRILLAAINLLLSPLLPPAAMDCADQTQLGLNKCADAIVSAAPTTRSMTPIARSLRRLGEDE